jgi:aminoglycoside phosphotransferase (APT) family kinase protein
LLGRALKELHRINPPASVARCTRFSLEKFTRTAATITHVRPDVTSLAQRLAQLLIAKHREANEAALLHGDLHPKNILLDRERVVLLDLDQAAVGNPAADLGSVIAGLYCNACVGSLAWAEALSLQRAFLTGYGPHDVQSLRWHVAAALLQERALRSVTRVRLDSLAKLPEILATAYAVLNGGLGEN